MNLNKSFALLGVAFGFALLFTGCETDGGITARIREKSAVYGALPKWERNQIGKGDIAVGFTPDMVYMAVGSPSKVETGEVPRSGKAEIWVYNNFYPLTNATDIRQAGYQTYTPYQPSWLMTPGASGTPMSQKLIPIGTGGLAESIGKTGPPQGGNMEPADLQSYRLSVWFQAGKVIRIVIVPA